VWVGGGGAYLSDDVESEVVGHLVVPNLQLHSAEGHGAASGESGSPSVDAPWCRIARLAAALLVWLAYAAKT
jgi:hypothetical protein